MVGQNHDQGDDTMEWWLQN